MCGFVAEVWNDRPADIPGIERALDAIKHRGPDGRAVWRSRDGRSAIGFHRLALVGPRHEMQPFTSGDSRVHVVVNGEVYGHADLRRQLEGSGARFTTQSDCEVILHGYLQSGIEYIRRLNGEFAGLIWDQGCQRLYAIRDRWGVKPLFYRATPDGIQLASEVKALFALGLQARWDRAALHQHLFASIGPSQTLFNEVRQVPPGHALAWSGAVRSITPATIADPVPNDGPDSPGAPDELMRDLVHGLDQAVRDRLDCDAPVALYLSGGIDSASVATLASRHTANMDAFTVDFGHGNEDAARAGQLAAGLGLRHHVLPVSPDALAAHFEATVSHAETIGFNAVGAARWMLGRALAESGHKAVLVGDGSDELFGGYAFSVMDSFCLKSPAHARQAEQLLAQSQRIGMGGAAIELFGTEAFLDEGFCPYLITSWNFHRCGLRSLLSRDFLFEFESSNAFEMLLADIGRDAVFERRGLRRSLLIWQKSLFVNQILVSERLDMAHGVEARYPFLDNRVASVAAATPDEWLVSDMREKRLLRQAMEGIVPRVPGASDKRPFAAPPVYAGGDGVFSVYLRDLIGSRDLRESNVFDAAALGRLLDGLPSMPPKVRQQWDGPLMLATSFLVLQRAFNVLG